MQLAITRAILGTEINSEHACMSTFNPRTVIGLDTGRLGIWNPANILTASRLMLGIFTLLAFELSWLSPSFTVFLIFVGASTDLDGFVARRLDCASDFGKFFDPVADKLFLAMVGTWAVLNVGIVAPLIAGLIFTHFLIAVHTLSTKSATDYDATRFGKKAMMLTLTGLVLAIFMHNVIEIEESSLWNVLTGVWLGIAIGMTIENYRRIIHQIR